MHDLSRAVRLLHDSGAACVFVRGDSVITRTETGIAPLLHCMEAQLDLRGYSVADKIVGKAAALLFTAMGVAAVHGTVMSEGGARVLAQNKIPHSCDTPTKQIINRTKTDICPMEKAAAGIDDPQAAYALLQSALALLQKKA